MAGRRILSDRFEDRQRVSSPSCIEAERAVRNERPRLAGGGDHTDGIACENGPKVQPEGQGGVVREVGEALKGVAIGLD